MSRYVVSYDKKDHPMEEVLDIESGTTIVPSVEVVPTERTPCEEYDPKDDEIEEQFQEIYDVAMTAFESTSETVASIEPKYRARNEEVAIQYLNTALAAARDKAGLKQHKDKISITKVKASGPRTVNNNLIVADRNDMLKKLLSEKYQQQEDDIEGTTGNP